jgi:hypothetical protein
VKKGYLIIVVLMALLLALWVFMRFYFNDYLLAKLKKELEKSFGTYYNLTFTDIVPETNGKNLSIRIYGASLKSDTTNHEMRELFPAIFFTSEKLSVENIDVWALLINKELFVRSVELESPALQTFFHNQKKKTKPVVQTDKKKNRPKINSPITLISIDKVVLDKGSVRISNNKTPEIIAYSGKDIGVEITSVKFNLVTGISALDSTLFENIKFKMVDILINPQKGDHSIKANAIEINIKEDIFKLSGVALLPHKNLLKLSKEAQYQKTFANLSLGTLTINGFEFNKLIDGILRIKKIQLDGAKITLLRNKQKEFDKSLIKKSFQDALQNPGLALDIDTIKISNSKLLVDILFNNQHKPAEIILSNISGNITHLKTHSNNKETMKLALSATIMKTGKLHFTMSVPLRGQIHNYRAVIKHIDLTEWNVIIGKASPIIIKSGLGRKVVMSGTATNNTSRGKLTFIYDSLDCDVYKKDENGRQKKSWFYSVAANSAIHYSNPIHKNDKPREVDFYFEKQPFQGQSMLWIGGLVDGMIKTMLKDLVLQKLDKKKHRHDANSEKQNKRTKKKKTRKKELH